MTKDMVVLVDEQDNVVGEMDKIEAHRGDGFLHRASSVFLFRKNKKTSVVELLIQKRSQEKIVGANQWGNTVCGNVRPDENYEDCAIRRLKEELGISADFLVDFTDIYNFIYHVKCNNEFSEREIDHVFFAFIDDDNFNLSPNIKEVSEHMWVDWRSLAGVVESSDFDSKNPTHTLLQVNSGDNKCSIMLNPWTLIMLSKPKLVSIINQCLDKNRVVANYN